MLAAGDHVLILPCETSTAQEEQGRSTPIPISGESVEEEAVDNLEHVRTETPCSAQVKQTKFVMSSIIFY